jgi:hypothetical protein
MTAVICLLQVSSVNEKETNTSYKRRNRDYKHLSLFRSCRNPFQLGQPSIATSSYPAGEVSQLNGEVNYPRS